MRTFRGLIACIVMAVKPAGWLLVLAGLTVLALRPRPGAKCSR
jgi:hypothetical protein